MYLNKTIPFLLKVFPLRVFTTTHFGIQKKIFFETHQRENTVDSDLSVIFHWFSCWSAIFPDDIKFITNAYISFPVQFPKDEKIGS